MLPGVFEDLYGGLKVMMADSLVLAVGIGVALGVGVGAVIGDRRRCNGRGCVG